VSVFFFRLLTNHPLFFLFRERDEEWTRNWRSFREAGASAVSVAIPRVTHRRRKKGMKQASRD